MTELFQLYDRVWVKVRDGNVVKEIRGEVRSRPCERVDAAEYEVLLAGEVHPARIAHADIRLDGERSEAWNRKAVRIDTLTEEKRSPSASRALSKPRIFARWLREPVIQQDQAA